MMIELPFPSPIRSSTMVHPSQRRPPQRKPRPCVTITRDGTARTFRVSPWLAGAVVAVSAIFLSAYIGATAYLIYRDDLLGAAVARQVELQYSYEDRVKALRAEIDRVTSKHLAETQGVEKQLATLLQRQEMISERQSSLDRLVEKARATGLQIAAGAPPVPAPQAEPEPMRAAAAGPEPLAFGPSESRAGDIITGTLIRNPAAGQTAAPQEDLRPLLFEVQSSLDAAESRQSATLESLSMAARSKADEIAAALAPISIEAGPNERDDPQGGPFVPAPEMHFVERTVMLSRTLDEIADLRRSAEAMPLAMPLAGGRISSRFGNREDPFLNRPALHAGLDFAAASGANVQATAAGVVVSAGWSGGYGLMVELRHAGGLSTRYAHLSQILVEPGDRVSTGTPIGRVGSTGRSTGPHLHYEARRDGEALNPAVYLAAGQALYALRPN